MKYWHPLDDDSSATPCHRRSGPAWPDCLEPSVPTIHETSPGPELATPGTVRALPPAARSVLNRQIWAIALVLALSPGATDLKADRDELPPPSKRRNVSFGKEIKVLFDRSCVKCHSGENAKGKLRLDTRESVLKGGDNGAVIVPGKSDQSRLVLYVADLVSEMQMPPLAKRAGFPALTKEQVGLVRAWIDQGAK